MVGRRLARRSSSKLRRGGSRGDPRVGREIFSELAPWAGWVAAAPQLSRDTKYDSKTKLELALLVQSPESPATFFVKVNGSRRDVAILRSPLMP